MAELVNRSEMSEGRLALVMRTIAEREPEGVRVRVVLDQSWDHEKYNAATVVVSQPRWMVKVCPWEHLRQARRDRMDYLVVVGRRAVTRSDVELVVTVAHELEHVRQERVAPGTGGVGDAVISFIAETGESDGGRIKGRYDFPVEHHAEAVAARFAAEVLGEEAVRSYYEGLEDSRARFARPSARAVGDAAADLASLVDRHWSAFVDWFRQVTLRADLPRLADIEGFRDRHLRRERETDSDMRGSGVERSDETR